MEAFGLSTETQIVLLIAALYLYDAALLLSFEEGLLIRDAGRWSVRFSTDGLYVARRFLHWPQLVRLHAQVYRLGWNCDRIVLQAALPVMPWEAAARGVRWLAPLAYGQALNLVVLLPLALFKIHSNAVLLLVAGLIYLVGLTQAICVWRGAEHWGLSKKDARSIALEVSMCPPLGLSVVRKVTLHLPRRDNLLVAAAQVMPDAPFREVRNRAVALIEDELQNHDEASPVAQRLRRSIDVLSR